MCRHSRSHVSQVCPSLLYSAQAKAKEAENGVVPETPNGSVEETPNGILEATPNGIVPEANGAVENEPVSSVSVSLSVSLSTHTALAEAKRAVTAMAEAKKAIDEHSVPQLNMVTTKQLSPDKVRCASMHM